MIEVVSHHFSGEVYAKHVRIKDGHYVATHKHKFDHMSILASGCVIVEADNERKTYYSPSVIEIKAGVAHSVIAVNGDAEWFCIHAIQSDIDQDDIEAIDGSLILNENLVI